MGGVVGGMWHTEISMPCRLVIFFSLWPFGCDEDEGAADCGVSAREGGIGKCGFGSVDWGMYCN